MNQEENPLDKHSINNAQRVAYLIAGHIRKTLSPLERRELDTWLEASEQNIALFEELTDEAHIQKAMDWYARLDKEKTLEKIKEKIQFSPAEKRGGLRFLPIAVAASVVLAVGAAAYFLMLTHKPQPEAPAIITALAPVELPPGSNQAILTLGDGRRLILDSASNGALANEGHTQVLKTDSALAYREDPEAGLQKAAVYNTLETPTGGQYQLTLSDGTRVWLNAASSLKYPTTFNESERIVELIGEAYFEVKHLSSHPFKVKVGDLVIEDIGTAFNVNAYRDEGLIKTTLVEGAVKVMKGKLSQVLQPGEEVQASASNLNLVPADLEAVTGWKKGQFVFHRTPIAVVMKNLERWYGLQILNKDNNQNHLVATIDRNLPLSKMLYYLEKTGAVHFQWKGKNLIVLP